MFKTNLKLFLKIWNIIPAFICVAERILIYFSYEKLIIRRILLTFGQARKITWHKSRAKWVHAWVALQFFRYAKCRPEVIRPGPNVIIITYIFFRKEEKLDYQDHKNFGYKETVAFLKDKLKEVHDGKIVSCLKYESVLKTGDENAIEFEEAKVCYNLNLTIMIGLTKI